MVIDLDSFFESTKSGLSDLGEEKKTKLDFQKEVEDRIKKAQSEAEKGDFEFLKKIYEEVKKFEEDLPFKFLGIEKESNVALQKLGKQYSKEFIIKAKENVSKLSDLIKSEIEEIDKNLSSSNFAILLDHFSKALKYYNSFPKEFFLEKNKVGTQLRTREIEITKKLQQYKDTELKRIKKSISDDVVLLDSILKPGEINSIEQTIGRLHNTMSRLPKIFLASLTEERIFVSRAIIKAENFLEQEYQRVFAQKEGIIHNLIETFHTHQLNNDLNNILTVYNQILIEFELIPDVFLEKKMIIYEKINDLYASVNNLVIKNSVSNFLESYNYSKIIEEAREYIEHARITKRYDLKNLVILKEKLNKVPQKYSSDKELILKNINTLIESIQTSSTQKTVNLDEKIKNNGSTKTHINQKLIEEIDDHYKRLKESNNVDDAKKIYKKLVFCVDLLPIPGQEKRVLIKKANEEFNLKMNSTQQKTNK